jgi:hypothetical protein
MIARAQESGSIKGPINEGPINEGSIKRRQVSQCSQASTGKTVKNPKMTGRTITFDPANEEHPVAFFKS